MFAAPDTIPSLSQMHFLECLAHRAMNPPFVNERLLFAILPRGAGQIQESAAFWPSTIQHPRPAGTQQSRCALAHSRHRDPKYLGEYAAMPGIATPMRRHIRSN